MGGVDSSFSLSSSPSFLFLVLVYVLLFAPLDKFLLERRTGLAMHTTGMSIERSKNGSKTVELFLHDPQVIWL